MTEALPITITPSLAERFWAKVDRQGPTPAHAAHLGPCWVWTGAKRALGYGRFTLRCRVYAAHRVAYQMEFGAPPADAVVMHRCDFARCVRPSHLAIGTVGDNNRDRHSKGRSGSARGTANGLAKLNECQVTECRALFREGRASIPALAQRCGVTAVAMRHAIRGTTWRHVEGACPREKRTRAETRALEILELASFGASTATLVRLFDMSRGSVNKLLRGATWKHVPRTVKP